MCLVMRPLAENAAPPLYGFARVPLKSREQESSDGGEAKEEGANINEYKYTDATKVRRSLACWCVCKAPGAAGDAFLGLRRQMVPDYPRIISLIRDWAKDGWSFKGVLASDHIDEESFPTWHELVFVQDDKATEVVVRGLGSSAHAHTRTGRPLSAHSSRAPRVVQYEYVRPADHASVLQEGTADKLVNATVFKTMEAWAAQGWRCGAVMWAKAISKKATQACAAPACCRLCVRGRSRLGMLAPQEGKGKILYDTAVIFKR